MYSRRVLDYKKLSERKNRQILQLAHRPENYLSISFSVIRYEYTTTNESIFFVITKENQTQQP